MLALGIDPDLHSTAIVAVEKENRVRDTPYFVCFWEVLTAPKSLTGEEAVVYMSRQLMECKLPKIDILVVEGQEIYLGKTKNPDSVLRVAQVAGAALTVAEPFMKACYFPRPKEWKGSVPKKIFHERVLAKIPTVKFGSKASHQSHLIDAAGLAIWGIERLEKENRLKV